MTGRESLVSAIVPVWNGERTLAMALTSIVAQDYAPIEIVVVDDGSTDATAAVARGFGAPVRYAYQDNAGPAAARNAGLRLARGGLVAFLDADDLWTPHKLSRQAAHLAGSSGTGAVVGRIRFVRGVAPEPGPPGPRVPAGDGWLLPSLGSMLARREVFERVGPIDPDLRAGEDVDWFMRARELGVRIDALDEIVLLYRRHPASLTQDRALVSRGLLSSARKALERRRAAAPGTSRPAPLPGALRFGRVPDAGAGAE